jgi:hypothetical protein
MVFLLLRPLFGQDFNGAPGKRNAPSLAGAKVLAAPRDRAASERRKIR